MFEIENGVSILNITSVQNPENLEETIMTITLSNGEEIVFILDRPVDGKDGNSITGITQEINDEDNSVTLIIHFSESEDIYITIPPGKPGAEIVAITMQLSNDGYYHIYTFYMSNGKEHVVMVERPATWITYSGVPDNKKGLVGDFYYDTSNNVIYRKEENGWVIQINLNDIKTEIDYYTVTFDLNVTSAPWPGWTPGTIFPNNKEPKYTIAHGHTFYDTYFDEAFGIPTPVREGYTFEGWYTVKTPTVNSTRFGDLVIIYRDMTLYANWVLN